MFPGLSAIVAATPVVDVDGTLFVQAGLFLALMFVLKPLLFDKWLEVQQRRADSIDGALTAAGELETKADGLGTEYESGLDDARERANVLRSREHRDEEQRQAEKLAQVRTQTASDLDRQREKITADAAAARAGLATRVDDLADAIASKLIGRSG